VGGERSDVKVDRSRTVVNDESRRNRMQVLGDWADARRRFTHD
jgi:hypothetical protein